MMTNGTISLFENDETVDLGSYADSSYLNYSMYVILDRALPHIGDGLKPVQRRILFSMNDLKLDHLAKYKKSARTVGDTLGKYHPHGDSACYEAMVLMAQPFLTHHPLVDGQGNWGSIDEPKSFAAMRYTESKMTKYSGLMLEEMKQGTVDWKPNFDGTMSEPVVFPSQLPNILINGTKGIAVGLATDIPPHNMEDVVNGCIALLKKKSISDEEIVSYVKYPDFPTGGEVISPLETIKEAYMSGNGKFKVRATIEQTENEVYITSIPFRVTVNKLLESIDEQIKLHKLPVPSMDDLSDKHTPVRIILRVKGQKNQDLVLSHLFATTELEITEKINFNMIGLNGKPETKPLPKIIREWCEFRQNIYVKKTQYKLDETLARLHIIDGLLVAYNNLDRVISIVREYDKPKEVLMAEFDLSDLQAKSILDLRLRQLAKLEESALNEEHAKLSEIRDRLMSILADDKKIKKEIIAELSKACKDHKTARKTIHNVRDDSKVMSLEDIVSDDPATVIVSTNNWIRTMKGHDLDLSKLLYKTGDAYSHHCESRSNLPIVVMGDKGRFFGLPIHLLPNGKSTGEPVSSKVIFQNGEKVHTILPFEADSEVLLTTSKGNGFRAPMEIMDSRVKKGKLILVLPDGDKALPPEVIKDEVELAMLTQQGRLIVIPIDSINCSNKSQGVKLADIRAKDYLAGDDSLVSIVPLNKDDKLFVFIGKKKHVLNNEKLEHYRASRARRGVFFEHGRNNLSISK